MNHALAAAMRALVKEYLILVTQLEQLQRQGLLSLQKLWFYIQPAMRTVDILAALGMLLPAPVGRGGRSLPEWCMPGGAGASRAGVQASSLHLGPGLLRPKPVLLHGLLICRRKTSSLVNFISSYHLKV